MFFLLAICLACIHFTEPSVVEEKQDVSKNNVEYPIIQNIEKEIKIIPEVQPIEEVVINHPTLKTLAQDKINDLFSTGYWSHTNSNGCDFTCRTKPYWNYYTWIGENLYKGPCYEEMAYKLWKESPSHLEVLQHPYTEEVLLKQTYEENHCYMVLIRGIKK